MTCPSVDIKDFKIQIYKRFRLGRRSKEWSVPSWLIFRTSLSSCSKNSGGPISAARASLRIATVFPFTNSVMLHRAAISHSLRRITLSGSLRSRNLHRSSAVYQDTNGPDKPSRLESVKAAQKWADGLRSDWDAKEVTYETLKSKSDRPSAVRW